MAEGSQTRGSLGLAFETAFLLLALGLIIFGGVAGLGDLMGDVSVSFVSIMLEAVPFMLIGSLVGGLIEVFVPQEFVTRVVGNRRVPAIFLGAGLGLIFPVCECAIVPVVRRLLRKGVPFAGGVAFLLGGPIVNPIVAASTWVAYGGDWAFTLARMAFGYVIAVSVSLIMSAMYTDKQAILDDPAHDCANGCACGAHDHGERAEGDILSRLAAAFQHACDDFCEVGKFLVIGAFVAAMARTAVGVEGLRQLSAYPGIAIIVMMGVAIALNLCSETDAFIAAGFRGLLPDSAQMAFLVLGPMLDIKLLLMNMTIFKKRFIIVLALSTFAAVCLSMTLLQHGIWGQFHVR